MIKTPSSTVIGGAGIWTPNTMIVGSIIQNLSSLIKSLFRNNEQGFACDPNDLSTIFQDVAGTISASVVQPVGMMLDKSKGLSLSAELFTAPLDFNNWNRTAAVTSFTANSFTTNGLGGCTKNPFFAGISPQKTYSVRFVGVTNVALNIRSSSNTIGQVFVPAGNFDVTIKSSITFSDGTIYMQLTAAGTVTLSSISVKELAGNHAYQTTSSMRPLLQDTPRRIQYDGVDDKLTTTLPSQLTGCTVIRAVPNVGTQILTNQTIPTPYNDATNHCGLIVINRVLTAAEISQITKLFNKAAGV